MSQNTIKEKIIEYIKRNKVSTTEIADCLGKTGAIEGVKAINQGMFVVGPVRYIYGHTESNWPIHEQARYVQKDEVVIMDGIQVNNRALVGELVSKFVILYQMAGAIVALGNMRDANDLLKNRYPVWCKGFNPIGCFNKEVEETEEIREIVEQRKQYYDGAVAVCDDTGVVIIPRDKLTEEFYQKLEFIELQEDTWFDCIDRKKWDTYDTVCKKRYLQEN